MRFGVSGDLIPTDLNDFSPEVARRVRELGFSGVFSRFRANDPQATHRDRCRRVRAILADHGLQMYQATGYWQPLIHPDETERGKAVRVLRAALRVAAHLGARGIDTGPGSLSSRGPWAPHPYNWTPQAREQLVKSLKEAAPTAEDVGVYLSLEGHQLVTLSCAEMTRDVLDEVGSPFVVADFDPVNWIRIEDVYDTGTAVGKMMDVLGRRIVSAHAKDVVLEDRMVLHIDQRPAGQGVLDYRVFLGRLEALDPCFPMIVEGAALAELQTVSDFLHRTAGEIGISVL